MILILLAAFFLTLGNALDWQKMEDNSASDYIVSAAFRQKEPVR